MNISTIDFALAESKPTSPKTEAEGTDLFSILMASIAAGNGIQQGSALTDLGTPALTGQDVFSTVDVTATGKDADSGPAVTDVFAGLGKPATEEPTISMSAFMNTIDAENGDEGVSDAALKLLQGKLSDSDYGKTGADGIMGEFTNRSHSVDSLNPLVAGEVEKGLSLVVPYQTPEKTVTVNAEKETELQLPGFAGPVEKAPTGDSVRLSVQIKKAEAVDPSNAQSLLLQAVRGVKEGDGIEAKESNVKDGTIVSGNDEVETVKGLDIGDLIVPALGRESIDPRLFHASAKPLAAVDGQRPQIDPVDLVAQVSGKIKADFNSEGGEVRMELHPESLGHLKIEIKVEGGVIRANILTENAMVKETIDSNLPMLRSSLEEHGLRIDQLSVGVDQRQGGNAFAERKDVQMWQGFDNADASRYEGEEPANESWYSADRLQEQGVSIFA